MSRDTIYLAQSPGAFAEAQKQQESSELEATRRLAEEQKQRAELSEQREKDQKEAGEKLRQAASKLRRRAIGAVCAGGRLWANTFLPYCDR